MLLPTTRDIQDYLFAIIFGPDSPKTSHLSSRKQIISEEFVDKIENILFGPDQEKTEILSFRNDILESHLNKKLVQEIEEGEKDISKLDIYFSLNDRYFFNLSQSILDKYFENDLFLKAFNDYGKESFTQHDKKIRESVTLLIDNLIRKYYYSEIGAIEMCKYVLENDLPKKFRVPPRKGIIKI